MKNVWKWILGIFLVLVLVAVVVIVPFAMRSHMLAFNSANNLPQARGWNNGPMMPGAEGWQHPQVPGWSGNFDDRRDGGRGFYRDFASQGRFLRFGFGLRFLAGFLRLIPLALLGLLIYGVYQLGKRAGLRASTLPAPVPVQPAPPEATEPEKNDTPGI